MNGDVNDPVWLADHWKRIATSVVKNAEADGVKLVFSDKDELEKMRARKDETYRERNMVVAALASVFTAGITKTAIEGWHPEWHGCVYIDTPVGQLSWHYHDSQAHLFEHLPPYEKEWDGHTTEDKYSRMQQLKELEFTVFYTRDK